MSSPFHIFHLSDCYEVVINGRKLVRLTVYPGGGSIRQEVEWDDAPKEVKEEILKEFRKGINN